MAVRISESGAVGDGIADDTAALSAAVLAAKGGTLYFDVPGAEYLTGKLSIKSNTVVIFEPSVKLRKKLNGSMLLSLNDVENVTIRANGATFDGSDLPGTTSFSHTVYLFGARKCLLENLNVTGAATGGGGMDCLYLGDGSGPCEDIHVVGGSYTHAKRNNISVVSALRTNIEGVECAYATGSPGCGIDVEANNYGKAFDTTIRNCHLHHNQNAGVVSTFGVRTRVIDCDIHDNGFYGVAVSSGGAEFHETVYRPNLDVWGVVEFSPAGVITLGGDVNHLPVGTVVSLQTRSGAVKPAEYTAPFYVVSRHAAPNGIVLGSSVGSGEVISLAGAGSGTFSADPTVAHTRLRAFVCGQSDGALIQGNRIYRNGTRGVSLVGSGHHCVERNEIWNNGTHQIEVQYTSNIEIKDNHVFMVSPAPPKASGITVNMGGGYLEITGNRMEDLRRGGLQVVNWSGARVENNTLRDCGGVANNYAAMWLQLLRNPRVVGNTVYQSELNTDTQYGIRAEVSCVDGVFQDNNCFKAGTSNARSVEIMSATNVCRGNTLRDGSKSA